MCMYIGVKYLDKHYTIHLYRLLISYNLDFFVLLLFLCTVISFELCKDIKKIQYRETLHFYLINTDLSFIILSSAEK